MPLAMQRAMGWISLSQLCSLPCLLDSGRAGARLLILVASAAMAVAAKLFIAGAWYIILGGLAGHAGSFCDLSRKAGTCMSDVHFLCWLSWAWD